MRHAAFPRRCSADSINNVGPAGLHLRFRWLIPNSQTRSRCPARQSVPARYRALSARSASEDRGPAAADRDSLRTRRSGCVEHGRRSVVSGASLRSMKTHHNIRCHQLRPLLAILITAMTADLPPSHPRRSRQTAKESQKRFIQEAEVSTRR